MQQLKALFHELAAGINIAPKLIFPLMLTLMRRRGHIVWLSFSRGNACRVILRTKVHTSDRSPHLIVSGRLLLKNDMVKCRG